MGKGDGGKKDGKDDLVEDVERGNWDNQCDFFLSCLGYAVGLGNVWRFPYLCYEHGGVTFLIAYLVMLLISGLPLFFLELAIGQYAGQGPLKVFGRMAPGFKGLGYGMLIISFLVVIYYNMIIAWTLFYTFAGFASELPWQFCKNSSLTSVDCFQRTRSWLVITKAPVLHTGINNVPRLTFFAKILTWSLEREILQRDLLVVMELTT